MKKREGLVIILAGFILMMLSILLFRPVYDHGDASAYINYARAIAEKGNTDVFLHRSPLYSWMFSIASGETNGLLNGIFIVTKSNSGG